MTLCRPLFLCPSQHRRTSSVRLPSLSIIFSFVPIHFINLVTDRPSFVSPVLSLTPSSRSSFLLSEIRIGGSYVLWGGGPVHSCKSATGGMQSDTEPHGTPTMTKFNVTTTVLPEIPTASRDVQPRVPSPS